MTQRTSADIPETTKSNPRRFRFGFREERMLFSAHQPQMVGAATLHEAQIIGVINDARELWFDDVATEAWRVAFIGSLDG